nr:RNA polymerase sigma factor sigA-like [Ipomoea batatas]
MVTATIVGLSSGKRLLCSSFYYSDIGERLSCGSDHTLPCHQVLSVNSTVMAKKSSNYSTSCVSNQRMHSIKAIKENVTVASNLFNMEPCVQRNKQLQKQGSEEENQLEDLLLLQKFMLEKQWNLSAEKSTIAYTTMENNCKNIQVTCSGTSARRRRIDSRRQIIQQKNSVAKIDTSKRVRSIIGTEQLQNSLKGYVKGIVSEELLTHGEVVELSKMIKLGLYLEEQKSRLKDRLGCDPSEEQLAVSLRISRTDLKLTMIECSLAREKLAMSNGGLVGLLRGIEKFDPSKGYKLSTYVYWWIRQGISRALVKNSSMLRLPKHLHGRLSLIRNAETKLKDKGITPSIDRIAETLNISKKKVTNATEAVSKVFSLDREAFPSIDGLPGKSLHSYIADSHLENNPWHRVDEWALKDEVNNLIHTTLKEREREIIRLYHGLDNECLTWEDISKRIGLSRERVRQVGLVAFEKLKHAARKKRLKAMLASNTAELQMAYQDAWRVCHPDFKRPFSSLEDACERFFVVVFCNAECSRFYAFVRAFDLPLPLLPYHVVADYEAEEDDKILDSDTTGQILSRSQQWDHNIAAKVAEFTATFEKQVLAFNIISRKREQGEFRTEEKLQIEQMLVQEEKLAFSELMDMRQKAGRETHEANMQMAAMVQAEQARAESHARAEMMSRGPIRASALGPRGGNILMGHDGGEQVQEVKDEEMMNGWGNNTQKDEKEPSEDFLNDEETENGEGGIQSDWRGGGELDLNTR